MKKLLALLGLLSLIIQPSSVVAATILFPQGGGTGIGSATAGDVGNCLKVSDDSPFTYTLGTCGTGSGGDFSFTPLYNGTINATDTIMDFRAGFISSGASSSISDQVKFTGTATTSFNSPITMQGWAIGTSTTVCKYPENCQYQTDGTNDDVQIQSAIDFVNGEGGGTVYIKAGVYDVGTRILLKSGVRLLGEGYGTTIKSRVTWISQQFNAAIVASSTQNVAIENIHFDGSQLSQGAFNSDVMVRFYKTNNFMFVNNWVTDNYGFAVFASSNANSSTTNGIISGNYLEGLGKQDIIGGGPQITGNSTTSNIIISNNVIAHTALAGRKNSTMDVNCIDMVKMQGITFTNNVCYGDIVAGDERHPNYNTIISDNVVYGALGTTTVAGSIVILSDNDVATDEQPGWITITGNTLRQGNIYFNGNTTKIPKNIVISNNTVRAPKSGDQVYNTIGTDAIRVDNAQNVVISNNSLFAQTTGTGAGVRLTGVINAQYMGNLVDGFAVGANMGSGTRVRSILNQYVNNTTDESNPTDFLRMDSTGNIFTSDSFNSSSTAHITGATTLGSSLNVTGSLNASSTAHITGTTTLTMLKGGRQSFARFTAQSAELPSSNFATLSLRNDHPILEFSNDATSTLLYSNILPKNYNGGSLALDISYTTTHGATSTVGWHAAFERIGDNVLDIDADSFATVQKTTATPSTTSGTVTKAQIVFTSSQIDGLLAGEMYRIKLVRDPSDAALDEVQFLAAELREL